MKKLLKQEIFGWLVGLAASVGLYYGAYTESLPISTVEVLGFATGAACVWLTVKQNIWSWPIGIANNIFFIVLFFNARLFADMSLQVIYIVLALLGWYWWLKGGVNKSRLKVSHLTVKEGLILAVLASAATYGMTHYLQSINDAAPFLDALTTVMSLVAQYMLTRKRLENWLVWISADVIYIYLYINRELYLTGVLYLIFLLMCLVGLKQWRESMKVANESIST